MVYMGSKNRLSKDLAPIIQQCIDNNGISTYIEPFVGGGNMIDKIHAPHKYGFDNNRCIIALLKQMRDDTSALQQYVLYDRDFYKAVFADYTQGTDRYPAWVKGLVGVRSFRGKFFGGYSEPSFDNEGKIRWYLMEHYNNIVSQAPKLAGTDFKACDFRHIPSEVTDNAVIYCDPPYRGTAKYTTGDFPYDEFYVWCREKAKRNIVLVSEYDMPDDFYCIWSKEIATGFDSIKTTKKVKAVEKLFLCLSTGK